MDMQRPWPLQALLGPGHTTVAKTVVSGGCFSGHTQQQPRTSFTRSSCESLAACTATGGTITYAAVGTLCHLVGLVVLTWVVEPSKIEGTDALRTVTALPAIVTLAAVRRVVMAYAVAAALNRARTCGDGGQ